MFYNLNKTQSLFVTDIGNVPRALNIPFKQGLERIFMAFLFTFCNNFPCKTICGNTKICYNLT